MAIIEIHGGPINHRYLMKKSKDELASMYMRLLRDTEQDAKDAERYRWMKQQRKASLLNIFDPNGAHDYDETDAVIDAAMQGANV